MTWRHTACVIGAMLLPVLCGLSPTCSAGALEKVIWLSSNVVAAVMGNAMGLATVSAAVTNSGAVAKEKAP